MSVQVNQYLVYGYMLSCEEAEIALEEKLKKESDLLGDQLKKYCQNQIEILFENYSDCAFDIKIVEINGCSLILDIVCGKYVFFGKIFQKSDNHEKLSTCDIPKISVKIKKNVEKQLLEVFGNDFNLKPKMILLNNYR